MLKFEDKVYTENCLFKITAPYDVPYGDVRYKGEIDCCIGRSIAEVLEQYKFLKIDHSYYPNRYGNYIKIDIYNPSRLSTVIEEQCVDIMKMKSILERNSFMRELYIDLNMTEIYFEKYMHSIESGADGTKYPAYIDQIIDYGLLYEGDKYPDIKPGQIITTSYVEGVLDLKGHRLNHVRSSSDRFKIRSVGVYNPDLLYTTNDLFYIVSVEDDIYEDLSPIPVSTMKVVE